MTVSPCPQPADDVEELVGALVARVLVEEVAVGALFGGSPPMTTLSSRRPRDWREGGRHLCRQRRADQPGAERDEELQPSVTREHGAVSHASSHHAPVGVSAPSKPSCSAPPAIWPR